MESRFTILVEKGVEQGAVYPVNVFGLKMPYCVQVRAPFTLVGEAWV